MKRLFAVTLAIALALSISVPALARGANLEPTIVTSNADGTTTFSTTATPTQDYTWLFVKSVETGLTWAYVVYPTADGSSITISATEYPYWNCPCVAWFGQTNNTQHWHPYSATSETFTP